MTVTLTLGMAVLATRQGEFFLGREDEAMAARDCEISEGNEVEDRNAEDARSVVGVRKERERVR